ncbi:hypothetical protein CFE70_002851 [Pyrenophora teres f. teres 0-1]
MIRIEEPMATLARISNVGVVAGRGLVASQEIERGALIVQENALRQEYYGGAVYWSPRKLREARAREAVRERDEAEEKLQKAQAKKQREES